MNHPIEPRYIEHVCADEGNALDKCFVQPFNRGAHQGYGQNADDDAKRRQYRPHLVGANGAPGDEEAFFELGEEGHGVKTSKRLAEIPNSKSQIPKKSQFSNPKTEVEVPGNVTGPFGAWDLG